MLKWLEGKKTYITAGVIAIIAGCNALGIAIPQWVIELLVALGLTSLRSAIK